MRIVTLAWVVLLGCGGCGRGGSLDGDHAGGLDASAALVEDEAGAPNDAGAARDPDVDLADANPVPVTLLPFVAGLLAVTPRGLFATTRENDPGTAAEHLWFAPFDESAPRDLGEVGLAGALAAVDGTAYVASNPVAAADAGVSGILVIDATSGARTLIGTGARVTGVAADATDVFWGEGTPASNDPYLGRAMRMEIEGGSPTVLAITEGSYALLLSGEDLYWGTGFGELDSDPPQIVGSRIQRVAQDAVLGQPETVTTPAPGTGTWSFGVDEGTVVFLAAGSSFTGHLDVGAPDAGAAQIAPWSGSDPAAQLGNLAVGGGRTYYTDGVLGELESWAPGEAAPAVVAWGLPGAGALAVNATWAYVATANGVVALALGK